MITQEQIEATRQTLRERLIDSLQECHPNPVSEECVADEALDALVAFEQAAEAVNQAEQWVTYIGPYSGTLAVLDTCRAILAKIIESSQAVQE